MRLKCKEGDGGQGRDCEPPTVLPANPLTPPHILIPRAQASGQLLLETWSALLC